MVVFACVVIHQPLPSGWDDHYNEPKNTIRTFVVTPEEFRALRDAPGKMIEADIEFQPMADASEIWEFRDVPVENQFGYAISVNGTYDPRIGYIKFNFVLRDGVKRKGRRGKQQGRGRAGPICRLEIKGRVHPGAGRTHKQAVTTPTCVRDNLPVAEARPDLEKLGLREAWGWLCQQAKIEHKGQFIVPPTGGK